MSSTTEPAAPEGALVRTRLAWMRTGLATIIIGFLLVRGWLTNAEPWTLAALAAVFTGLVVVASMTRFAALGQRMPPAVSGLFPRLVTTGIIALAAIALGRLILAA